MDGVDYVDMRSCGFDFDVIIFIPICRPYSKHELLHGNDIARILTLLDRPQGKAGSAKLYFNTKESINFTLGGLTWKRF